MPPKDVIIISVQPRRRKYFFFDIDGTLATGLTTYIPQSTRDALRILRENGHFLAIATGRLQTDAIKICQDVGIQNIISDGGNSLTLDGILLYIDSLPRKPIISLLDELEEKHIPWGITIENQRTRHTRYSEFFNAVGDRYFDTIIDPDLDYHLVDAFYKVYVVCQPWEEKNIALLSGMPTVRYADSYLFIEPDNKADGIKKMMDYMAAPYKDVVVFGDGTNDRKMFLPEWTSIAMGNACNQLKSMANFVTKSCLDDGIYYACEYFGWI